MTACRMPAWSDGTWHIQCPSKSLTTDHDSRAQGQRTRLLQSLSLPKCFPCTMQTIQCQQKTSIAIRGQQRPTRRSKCRSQHEQNNLAISKTNSRQSQIANEETKQQNTQSPRGDATATAPDSCCPAATKTLHTWQEQRLFYAHTVPTVHLGLGEMRPITPLRASSRV